MATSDIGNYGRARTADEPASAVVLVTTSDIAGGNFTTIPRGLRFGVGGTISLLLVDGTTVTDTVYDGETLAWACVLRVNTTGTTATTIKALY